MGASRAKEEALRIIDGLPKETSWHDIIYQIYVRKKIEKRIEAANQGRVTAHNEVKKQLSAK
jgi:hypothetical protein